MTARMQSLKGYASITPLGKAVKTAMNGLLAAFRMQVG